MYLNLVQIAESFGVAERVVGGWVRDDGMPHTIDGGRMLFDRSQVVEWAAARGLAVQAGFLAPEPSALAAGLRVEPLLRAGGIWRGQSAAGVVDLFCRVVASLPAVTPPVRHLLATRLKAKDGVTWAPVGSGFALPHPSTRISLGRDSGTVALVLLDDPLALGDAHVDEVPVTRLLFFIAPSPRAHLDLLGRLSRMLGRGPFRELLLQGAPDEDLYKAASAMDPASPAKP
jgi:PTS system nitrogen regulatory IIA component